MQQSFSDLGVSARSERALAERGIHTPFPIQVGVLPRCARRPRRPREGADRLGQDARLRDPDRRAAPRRRRRGRPRSCSCRRASSPRRSRPRSRARRRAAAFGSRPSTAACRIGAQIEARARDAHVLVATPGRLNDLLERRAVSLDGVAGPRPRRGRPDARHGLQAAGRPDRAPACRATGRPCSSRRRSTSDVGELARAYTTDPVRCDADRASIGGGRGRAPVRAGHARRQGRDTGRAPRGDRGLALVFVRTRRGVDRLVRKLAFASR